MRYLLILLISIAYVNALQYVSQEYRVRFNNCTDYDIYLQEGNCVNVDIPGCLNDKYLTIVNNGTLYLKSFSDPSCVDQKQADSTLSFDCENGNVAGATVSCIDNRNMGVFYRISSGACSGISGELNKCISFAGQEQCGYKSARFDGSNGNTPQFIGYSNSYCGDNDDEVDVISRFSLSCIKSDESKVFNLECGDTASLSSASTLIYTSSLLLFVILFTLL